MTILIITLTALLLVLVSLQRTYAYYPLKEIKRRARDGDNIANSLVKVVAYGYTVNAFLWGLIALVSAGLFVAISTSAPLWFSVVSISALLWLGFIWVPAVKITIISERLAAYLSPVISKIVSFIHPIVNILVRNIQKIRPVRVHTGIYDKQDLLNLLETQQLNPGNRIGKFEIGIAAHALTFGDKSIGEVMTPGRVVKMISVSDPIGPILLDELHASGHSRFPVFEGKRDNIVGTLYLHDLIRLKQTSSVKNIMKAKVYYLHEDQSLHDALQAVLTTHHHLFIVVNSFEEFVGVISSEDVFEAIIGRPIMDEFDKYENLREVAERAAIKDHKEHKKENPELKEENIISETTTEEPSEVIK